MNERGTFWLTGPDRTGLTAEVVSDIKERSGTMIDKESKVYIAGHKGMVGRAVWDRLEESGYGNLSGTSSAELDLRNQELVNDFMATTKPDIVIDRKSTRLNSS